MESLLRTALVEWVAGDLLLSAALNSVTEEAPVRTAAPWLGIAASASADWSTKDRQGREVRIALELHTRGEEAGETADLVRLIEDRVVTLPQIQPGFRVVTTTFLRARAEQRANHVRAVLLEYRFRLLEHA